jgi:dihydrofolate reductase
VFHCINHSGGIVGTRVDLNVSLDGYITTEDGTADNPYGEDWSRLTAAYAATRTFRQRVFHDDSGEGTVGVDDRYAAAYFEGIGAEIMGAGMFGFDANPDDPDWKGWWGDEPPFGCPVFVLTHRKRASIEMSGGTTFHFVEATPIEAMAMATAVAGGDDVRIGGGASTVREFLKAGLVDRLHVGIVPILLGRGVNLWDDLRGFERDFQVVSEAAESGTVHVTFTRTNGH